MRRRLPIRRLLGAMCTGLVLLTSVSFGAIADAASPAADLPSPGQTADHHVLRGRFVQHKHLAGLDKALVSRGRYVVARGRGLLWRVEQPIRSTLVITPNALTESSQGHQTTHISAGKQPALGAVASVLLAVFHGNTDQLSHYFDISRPAHDDNGHTLILTPKTDAVKHFIKRLKLTDDGKHIRRIRIDQPGGDYSVIDLKPSQGGASRLTPDERHAFSH